MQRRPLSLILWLALAPLVRAALPIPDAGRPADRKKFSNALPPFAAVYHNADVASLINDLRNNFAPSAPGITSVQVAAQRSKL